MRAAVLLTTFMLSAACASTPDDPASANAAQTIFETLPDGGVWHPASKAHCPAELAGLDFVNTEIFGDDPNNVGCQYEGLAYLTLYFFTYDGFPDAQASALDAANAIVSRFSEAEHLEEESENCSMTADSRQGIADALVSDASEDKVINIGKTPCYVFRVSEGKTLVATDKVGPWHLKVRMTMIEDNLEVADIVDLAATALNYERSIMAGKPPSVLDELLKP